MKNKIFTGFLWTSLILAITFLIGPLILLILQGTNYIVPSLLSEEVIFAIKLSIKTSIIATSICLLIAIPTSYAIHKLNKRYKKIIENIIYIPMSLPHLVSGIALLLLFGRRGIGEFLYQNFNIDFIFTVNGIILAQVFVNLSFAIKTILTSLEEINPKTVFIARTLGCNEFQAFIHVILPSMRRGIVSSTVMTWSRALGEFGAVMMVAGTTRMKTEILPTAIFLNMSTGDLDLAIGTATILIIISLICMSIFNILIKDKENG
mgnify:CR=1 FL=1